MRKAQTKRCPQCKSEVDAAELHCPNCPYSFPEAAPEAGEVHVGQTWSPLPMILLLVLASLAAASWLVVFRRGGPGVPESSPEPAPAPASPAAAPRSSYTLPMEPDAEPTYVSYELGRGSGAKVKEWRFRGKVVDLVSLKPVSGAKVSFWDPRGEVKALSVTDAGGGYRTVLPALDEGGYTLRVEAAGFSGSYLNPEVENVPGLEESRRRELARELENTVLPASELAPYGAQPLLTDLYLAPTR